MFATINAENATMQVSRCLIVQGPLSDDVETANCFGGHWAHNIAGKPHARDVQILALDTQCDSVVEVVSYVAW